MADTLVCNVNGTLKAFSSTDFSALPDIPYSEPPFGPLYLCADTGDNTHVLAADDAFNQAGRVHESTDNMDTWSESLSMVGTNNSNFFRAVEAIGGEFFVAAYEGQIWDSTTGAPGSWNAIAKDASFGNFDNPMTFAMNTDGSVALAAVGLTPATSRDFSIRRRVSGVWDASFTEYDANGALVNFSFKKGFYLPAASRFLLVSDNYYPFYSTNSAGTAWDRNVSAPDLAHAVADSTNTTVYGIDGSNEIFSTTDGITWTSLGIPDPDLFSINKPVNIAAYTSDDKIVFMCYSNSLLEYVFVWSDNAGASWNVTGTGLTVDPDSNLIAIEGVTPYQRWWTDYVQCRETAT